MGNETETGTKSARWWWSVHNQGGILRQSVKPDVDFDGHHRRLRPPGADGVMVASATLERFAEDDGYVSENLSALLAEIRDRPELVSEPVRRTCGLTYTDAQNLFDEAFGQTG